MNKEIERSTKNIRQNSSVLNGKTQVFGWWIEICTTNPTCTYYFGAFDSFWKATFAKYGYIQDLKQEGARLDTVRIKQCKPTQLTIFEEELGTEGLKTRNFEIFSTASVR